MTTVQPLEAIPVFLALLETGSIQGTAERLGISRPTVRKRIEELEAWVGAPLLHRTDDGLHPTASGTVYARRAREMLTELDVLARSARAVGVTPSGVLRIGMPTGTPPALLSDMCHAIRERLPEIRIELITSAVPRDELLRSVDCLFCLDIEEPEGPFVSIELGVVRERLIGSPEYLERHPACELEDLAGHALFGWIAPDTGRPSSLPVSRGVAPTLDFAICTDDPTALLWMAARGYGLSLVPFVAEIACPPFFEGGPLEPVLEDAVGRDRKRRLLIAEAVADLPSMRSFIEATRAAARGM